MCCNAFAPSCGYLASAAMPTWPGGPQYLPEVVIGPTTPAFDAAQTSGEFFVAHARKE